ncbi:unnamed protein product [Calicophoron daubneyi]|uniref:Vesicle-associated membrane protein 7 n=1 Tax=Calicophoron daubneyi TaxID=300641 RepID=A0AAV2TY49_CALDB
MSIFYCAIANAKYTVCEYSAAGRSFPGLVERYLSKNPTEQHLFYCEDGCGVHALTVSGLSFVLVTELQTPRHQPHQFITHLATDFAKDSHRVQKAKNGEKGCLQRSYGKNLRDLAARFGDFKTNQQMAALQSSVEGVTNQLRENVQQVMQRGDRLDTLITKTDDLESSAGMFETTSKKVESKERSKYLKLRIILIGIGVALLIIIILIILWQAGVFNHK